MAQKDEEREEEVKETSQRGWKELSYRAGDLRTLNIPFLCEELSQKLAKKDLKTEEAIVGAWETQVLKKLQLSPDWLGWLSPPDLPEGLCSHTSTYNVWSSRRWDSLHFPICSRDFSCSKKCFKDKGPLRWRWIMNSLPLLNVSSQPNVRGYSVRRYWADWKCQTGRNRERESTRRKQKEEEERGAQVLLWLRYGRVAVIIMLPNEEGFILNYCFAVVLTCFQLRLDPLYPSSQVDQTFPQTDNAANNLEFRPFIKQCASFITAVTLQWSVFLRERAEWRLWW